MNLKTFLDQKSKLKQITLSGYEAHSLLAPPQRMKQLESSFKNKTTPKKAAVLIHLYPGENDFLHFILIQRNSYVGVHSGQISFPGGKPEALDANLWGTALRESSEEVGLNGIDIHKLRSLTDVFIPPSNFLVSPFVSYSYEKPEFIPEKKEVDLILEIPLANLLDHQQVLYKKLTTNYIDEFEVPCYIFNEKVVWGATAMILSELRILFLS